MYCVRASRALEELAATLIERSRESAVCPAEHIPDEPFVEKGALQDEGDDSTAEVLAELVQIDVSRSRRDVDKCQRSGYSTSVLLTRRHRRNE